MGLEDFLKLGLTQLVILPIIGFFAVFAYKWFLQDRKSPATSLCMRLPTTARRRCVSFGVSRAHQRSHTIEKNDVVAPEMRKKVDTEIMGVGIGKRQEPFILSWRATDRLFRVLDVLRSKGHCPQKYSPKSGINS